LLWYLIADPGGLSRSEYTKCIIEILKEVVKNENILIRVFTNKSIYTSLKDKGELFGKTNHG
jgi:hypothetical protein